MAEQLVIIPVVAAIGHIFNKVGDMRTSIEKLEQQNGSLVAANAALQQQVAAMKERGGGGRDQNTAAAAAGGLGTGVASTLAKGLVIGSGITLCAKAGWLLYERYYGSSSGGVATDRGVSAVAVVATTSTQLHEPPAGYQPAPCVHDDDEDASVGVPGSSGSSSSGDACIICLSNRRDTLAMPCRHLAVCFHCAKALYDRSARRLQREERISGRASTAAAVVVEHDGADHRDRGEASRASAAAASSVAGVVASLSSSSSSSSVVVVVVQCPMCRCDVESFFVPFQP